MLRAGKQEKSSVWSSLLGRALPEDAVRGNGRCNAGAAWRIRTGAWGAVSPLIRTLVNKALKS